MSIEFLKFSLVVPALPLCARVADVKAGAVLDILPLDVGGNPLAP